MITYQYLFDNFDYDPKTGIVTRKKSIFGKKAGAVIGTLTRYGYMSTRINYKYYMVHRLAFLYMTGRWPTHSIDHINRNRSDNRWENLREATSQQNSFNRIKMPRNTSGIKGVTYHKQTKKWQAQIGFKKKIKYLGLYETKELAGLAYKNAAIRLHGSFHNDGTGKS